MITAVTKCFRHYFKFSGRAARSEFWYFVLFLVLVHVVLIFVNSLFVGPEVTQRFAIDDTGQITGEPSTHYSYNGGYFADVFMLATFIPWLAVGWRRMHDFGRPGYLPFVPWLLWIFIIFVFVAANLGIGPMIQAIQTTGAARVDAPGFGIFMVVAWIAILILNLYWLTRPSDPGENKYGPNPNEVMQ